MTVDTYIKTDLSKQTEMNTNMFLKLCLHLHAIGYIDTLKKQADVER